jgi:hypothetical protein
MEMLDLIESYTSEQASVRNLFGGEGRRVRDNRQDPRQLMEAMKLLEDVSKGRKPMWVLKEAMTTSDFPLMFADILDRQMLGNYQATTPTWQNYIRRGVVPDFRSVKRFAVDGATANLPEVDEREEYPEAPLAETVDTYNVRKYGRRIDLSWEALINDDLDAFRDIPTRLATAARRTETRLATQLFVDANGPHANLFSGVYGNVVPNNAPLSIQALQNAYTILAAQTDPRWRADRHRHGRAGCAPGPGGCRTEHPQRSGAVDWSAAVQASARSGTSLQTGNWMRGKLRLNVEPYIPVVASTKNGATSWFMFASPGTGRTALELGFLRGNEAPALYQRDSDASRVGGGPVQESFTDDSVAWRIRHVVGGGQLVNTGGRKFAVASNGSGPAAS